MITTPITPQWQLSLVTIAKLADALNCSKPAIRKHLAEVPACTETTVAGQKTQAWTLAALPENLRCRLAAVARHRGYRTIADLVKNPPKPYSPALPFDQIADQYQIEAQNWRDALASLLPRQHQLPAGELLALGLLEAKRIFGREIAENTWRAHFDEAVKRDNGFEQWQRLDLYVPAAAYQTNSQALFVNQPVADHWTPIAGIVEALRQIKSPTFQQCADLLHAVFECYEAACKGQDRHAEKQIKRSMVALIKNTLPALSTTEAGFQRRIDRDLTCWRLHGRNPAALLDGRAGQSGRKGKRLCQPCRKKLVDAAVSLDGDDSQAFRRLWNPPELGGVRKDDKGFCAACILNWDYDVRRNKSYVPASIRVDIKADVEEQLIHRHGPKSARLVSPHCPGNPNDIGPGDFFEADDVTFNHAWYFWDLDASGRPYVGRGECLVMTDRRTDYPMAYLIIAGKVDADGNQSKAHYNSEHVRLLVLRAHDQFGLPHTGFVFENGVWAARLIDGEPVKNWEFNPWANTEFGLNDPRLGITVRHTMPGNPRSKIIERIFGTVQNRMRCQPGFVGFNERIDRRELMQEFISRTQRGLEHPGNELFSMTDYRQILDNELLSFSCEPQNGKRLPGVSPKEAFMNGIGGHAGMIQRPLRQLGSQVRYLLATHQRVLPVTATGINFEIGSRSYTFWGDELLPWKHKKITARFNIEEPEVLTCVPPVGEPFTVKAKMLPANTATPGELSKVGAERRRWMERGKILYDDMSHPLRHSITRDKTHDEQTKQLGDRINADTAQHREKKAEAAKTTKRIERLASTLGVRIPTTPASPARTTQKEEALERMKQRRAALEKETITEDQQ